MDVQALLARYKKHIIALRRDFHAHPELSFKETRTAQQVCNELDRLGIPYVQLEENCVVGKLVGGKAKAGAKRLAIRADMDALPILEETGASYASQHPRVMHACGHDGHTAMLLGAANMLKDRQAELSGIVYLCFQSAEEVSGGAQVILHYLEQEGGADCAIAAHLWPERESGTICVTPGARMAGNDTFSIRVEGRGGHASRPDLCLDPIKPLCQMVLALASIPTNRVSTLSPCVVHVGRLEAGTMHNIFPQSASLYGGMRSFSEAGREQGLQAIRDIAEHTAKAYGMTATLAITRDAPVLINHEEATQLGQQVLLESGLFKPMTYEPVLASENFGCFLQAMPGFMAFIGTRNEEKGLVHTLHHPQFDIDEPVLAKGAAFFALYAEAFFKAE